MRIQQSENSHSEYALHLFNIFKQFCGSLPDRVERKKNNTVDIRFQTLAHSEFVPFAQMFYYSDKKGRKIPDDDELIEKCLTAKALAYWYMDDGGSETSNPRACNLYTHRYTENQVKRLIKILNKNFDLKAYSRQNKGKNIIIIPAESCETMRKLIDPYTLKCIKYKLPGSKEK